MADMLSSIHGLWNSEKYADLTLRCEGEVFKVHCAVVCTRSTFLSAAVDGQFKEAVLRDIELPEDEAPIICALIQYLYTNDYSTSSLPLDGKGKSRNKDKLNGPEMLSWSQGWATPAPKPEDAKDESLPLLFHIKMYIAGDKFDIPGLRRLATEKFENESLVHWNSAVFSEAAQHLWDNTVDTDRLLRNVVAQRAYENIHHLMDRGEFKDLMTSNGSFCFDIVKLQQRRKLEVEDYLPEVQETALEEVVVTDGVENDLFYGLSKKEKKKRIRERS